MAALDPPAADPFVATIIRQGMDSAVPFSYFAPKK
jgi:hypothetical protein